jgi:hypothetical protein
MPSAHDYFKQSQLSTDEVVYTAIKLPAQAITAAAGVLAEIAEPFSALIVDKDEVSLYIPLDQYADFTKRLPLATQLGEFRLITFEVEMEFDVVGFMAVVSAILAKANIPIMPFAAFSRDHILVPANQFELAWQSLQEAQASL